MLLKSATPEKMTQKPVLYFRTGFTAYKMVSTRCIQIFGATLATGISAWLKQKCFLSRSSSAPESFYEPLSETAKANLKAWLQGLNGKIMPENNWRWFRVFSNLALIKVCGGEKDAYWPLINEDLNTLNKFYIDEGWSSDGIWRPAAADAKDEGTGENAARGRHADYYSGSFAIQFSQILYAKFAADIDPERCNVFKKRAYEFVQSFWAYFDTCGTLTWPCDTEPRKC